MEASANLRSLSEFRENLCNLIFRGFAERGCVLDSERKFALISSAILRSRGMRESVSLCTVTRTVTPVQYYSVPGSNAFSFLFTNQRHIRAKKLSACRATLLGICQPPSPSGEKKGSRPCIGSMQRVARG